MDTYAYDCIIENVQNLRSFSLADNGAKYLSSDSIDIDYKMKKNSRPP